MNDPREMKFNAESGSIMEQDGRREEVYKWGSMLVDLCDLPVEEYMKPMQVMIVGGSLPDSEPTAYTLKFVIDGETVFSQKLYSGDIIPFDINPEKDGRNFKGWYYGSTEYYKGMTMPSKNITLTAKYECEVSFVFSIDGEESVVSSYTLAYNSKLTNIPNTNKEGYIFKGWEPSINNPVLSHTVYKGVFEIKKYTVTWNGFVNGPIVVEYNHGDALTVPENPEKEGYTFDKWNKEIPQNVTSNLVFDAIFNINKYNILYNIEWNGEIIPYSSFTGNYGATIPTVNIPTEKGYTFSEWNGAYEGNTVPSFDVEYISNKTINSYILTYYVNGEAVKEETYEYLSSIIPYEYIPEEGYTATKWTGLPENLIMPYNNVSAYCTTEIMKFTVVFIDQNGNELSRNENAPYGTKINTILPESPEGYEYTYDDETINGIVNKDLTINVNVSIGEYRVNINGESVLIEYGTNIENYIKENYVPDEGYYLNIKNITHETVPGEHDKASVEFTFEPNIWKLTYSTEGADENLNGSLDVAYGTYVLSVLPLTTKEHYNFGGWFNNGTLITSEFTMPNNDLIVNGNYLVNSYTVKVIDENGEVIFNKFYPYKTKLNTILTENEVVEYIDSQIGYNVNFSVNGEIINENMIIDSNINVTVNKTPKKYILTFKNDEEIISSTEVEFGSVILYPTMENKIENGIEYVFVWEDESYNGKLMSSNNLTIVGNYQEKPEAPIYYGSFVTPKSSYTEENISKYFEESHLETDYYNSVNVSDCVGIGNMVAVVMPAYEPLVELTDFKAANEAKKYYQLPTFLMPKSVIDNYVVSIFDAVSQNIWDRYITDNKIITINGNEYYFFTHMPNDTLIPSKKINEDLKLTIRLTE